jgi:hypothetical protein
VSASVRENTSERDALQVLVFGGLLGKQASQARDSGVAKGATHRAARADPSLRKKRLLEMTTSLISRRSPQLK